MYNVFSQKNQLCKHYLICLYPYLNQSLQETKDWRDTYMEANFSGARSLSDQRIDYIFGSQSKKWKVKSSYFINDATQDWTKLSDHLPYITTVDIK